jgi:hypothetical protein
MIAGGKGDDPARMFLVRQGKHGVGGTAQLEGAGRLMMLAFEQDRHAVNTLTPGRAPLWGAQPPAGYPFARRENFGERYRHDESPDLWKSGTSGMRARGPDFARQLCLGYYALAMVVVLSNLAGTDSRSSCPPGDKKRHPPSTQGPLSATLRDNKNNNMGNIRTSCLLWPTGISERLERSARKTGVYETGRRRHVIFGKTSGRIGKWERNRALHSIN